MSHSGAVALVAVTAGVVPISVDVEVVRGLPLGMSDAAADAVRRWTFRPARTASGPVASRKTIRIRFVVRAEDAR